MRGDIKKFLLTVSGYGATMALGILSGVISARLLGPQGRGELAAIQIVPVFLVGLAGLGMPQAIGYFTARQPSKSGEILGTAICISMLMAIPICALGYLFQARVLLDYSAHIRSAGIIFVAFVPVALVNGLPWSTLYGLEYFGSWNLARLQPQVIYCLVLIAAVLCNRREPGWISRTYLIGTATICVGTTWWFYRRFVNQRLGCSVTTGRVILPYGLISSVNFVPNALNQRVDQMLIAAALSASELGCYAVAVSWAGLLNPVMAAIGALILPRLASASEKSVDKTFGMALRWSLVILFLMALTLAAVTPFVIPAVFGSSYRDAIRPGLVLILAGAFSAFNLVLADGFRGCGRPEVPLYAESVGFIVTIGGLALLLKRFGIMGAAEVSLASYMCSTFVHGLFYFRTFPGSWGDWCVQYQNESKLLISFIANPQWVLATGVPSKKGLLSAAIAGER